MPDPGQGPDPDPGSDPGSEKQQMLLGTAGGPESGLLPLGTGERACGVGLQILAGLDPLDRPAAEPAVGLGW